MKHPTATAHRIIEAFWCCTCVPGAGGDSKSPVLFYVAYAFETLPYFRLQVCNFPPYPIPEIRPKVFENRPGFAIAHTQMA